MTAAIRLLQRIAHTLACQLASHLAHMDWCERPQRQVLASILWSPFEQVQNCKQTYNRFLCPVAKTRPHLALNLSICLSQNQTVSRTTKVAKTRPHLFAHIGRVQASSAFSPIHHFAALDDTSSAGSFSRKVKRHGSACRAQPLQLKEGLRSTLSPPLKPP